MNFSRGFREFSKSTNPQRKSKQFQLSKLPQVCKRTKYEEIESFKFDKTIEIERAWTPPGSWYTNQEFLQYEKEKIFRKNWIFAGWSRNVREPGDYIANNFMGEPYIIARGDDGTLRGFYNICRHHAAPVTAEGLNKANEFVCCYHGWTYALDGKLLKATKLKGIKDFSPRNFGLIQFEVEEVDPFVFLRFKKPENDQPSPSSILKPYIDSLVNYNYGSSMSENLVFYGSKVYSLNCNWKIVNDNYLDGEYHIPFVHPGLQSALDMSSYTIELHPKLSMQLAKPSTPKSASEVTTGQDFADRFSNGPVYGFMYPNFAINRIGPLLETNHIIPISYDKTNIVFEYYFDKKIIDDKDFIEKALSASDKVQVEDTTICERIFQGMSSSGYEIGRYAPSIEKATHHFHLHLAEDLQSP